MLCAAHWISVLGSFILVIAVVFHTAPTARLVGTLFFFLQEIILCSSNEVSSGLKTIFFNNLLDLLPVFCIWFQTHDNKQCVEWKNAVSGFQGN